MSKYSHLIEEGDAVRVLEGKWVGHVGKVNQITFGDMLLVGFVGTEVLFSRGQVEPLFDLEKGITIKVPEYQAGSDLYDKIKGFGMSTRDLAEFVQEFNHECQARISGVGDKQYSQDGFQKFEAMELDDLLEYAEEEVLDIPNYCAMLFIRIRRLRQALDAVDTLGRGTEEEYAGGNVTGGDFEEGGENEPANH